MVNLDAVSTPILDTFARCLTTMEIIAMGKTQSIVDAQGRPFPAGIQPGQYGKVVLDKSGNLAFEGKEKARSRSRGVA